MKKILLIYISSYLIIGGLGFSILPEFTQNLLLSNVIYDEPIIRLLGLLMAMLGGLIAYLVFWLQDFNAYPYSIFARTVLVFFVFWLWLKFENPMFLVLEIFVLIGLIPSYYLFFRGKFR